MKDTTGTPLLHNMSMRPRTTVTATVSVLGASLVRFETRRDRLSKLLDDPRLGDRLDEHWQSLGLSGALHVYPLPDGEAIGDTPTVTADSLLSLNVLGRARAGLLLPGAPLDLDPAHLTRKLAADDPRLVALAASRRRLRRRR